MNVTPTFFKKHPLKRHKVVQDFHPTLLQLLVKAAFLPGLFNLRVGVLIVASQRQGGPVRLIPAPGSAWRGGLGRPQPVLLPLFTQGLGAGWTTPLSTWQYNRKQGSGKILEACTHTCHSLDLRGSTLYYLGDTRKRKGEGGGLVNTSSRFVNGKRRRRGGMWKHLKA